MSKTSKVQAPLSAYFSSGASVAGGPGPTNVLSKRVRDRDLQLASFRSEAYRALQIKQHEGGGRPPLANQRKLTVLNDALNVFKADLEELWGNDDYPFLWSQMQGCEEYLRRIDPNAICTQQITVSGDVVQHSGEAEQQIVQPEATQSQKMSKLVQILEQGLLHVWDRNGQHVRFCSKEEYQNRCLEFLGWAPANSTAWNHLNAEKKAFLAGKGMRYRPNLEQITSSYEEMRKSFVFSQEEPVNDAKFSVKPAWYPILKPIIEELESIKGFSPSMVLPLVTNAIRECFRKEGVMDEESIVAWEPSVQWLRWFMKTQMDYRFRKM